MMNKRGGTMGAHPFFSIIVVSFNAEKYIASTIRSILDQEFSDFEIIVKDGISQDNTVNSVPDDDRVRIYIEKDTGIYDAMNQAVDYATGKYVLFLNCGDSFYDRSVLARASDALQGKENLCLYGNNFREGMLKKQSPAVTAYSLFRSSLCHQSVFFPMSAFRNGYRYREDFKITADHELMLNLYSNGIPFEYIDYPVCCYQGGGVSETRKGMQKLNEERRLIRKQYFSLYQRVMYAFRYRLTLPTMRKLLRTIIKSPKADELYRKIMNFYYAHSK